jgi:hypothetical protein
MFLTLAHGCASLLPRPPISCRNCFSPLNFPKWARSAMSLEKTSVEEMINTKPVYRLKTSAPPSSDPLEAAGGSRRQQQQSEQSAQTHQLLLRLVGCQRANHLLATAVALTCSADSWGRRGLVRLSRHN